MMEESDLFFNTEAFDGHGASKEVEELLSDMDSGLFFNDAASWGTASHNGSVASLKALAAAGQGPGAVVASEDYTNNLALGLPEPPTAMPKGQQQQQQQQQPPQPPQQQPPQQQAPQPGQPMGPPAPHAPPAALSSKNVGALASSSGGLAFAGPPMWKPAGAGAGTGTGGMGAGTASDLSLRSRSESFNALMDETGSIMSSDSSSVWGLDHEASGSSGSNSIPAHYQMHFGAGAGSGSSSSAAPFMMPSSSSSAAGAASRMSSSASVGSGSAGAQRRARGAGAKAGGPGPALSDAGSSVKSGAEPMGSGSGSIVNKRKQDRNAREQKRSLKISQQIGHLKEVLESDGKKVKNSKMAILVSVEQYIRELESQISEMTLCRNGSVSGGSGTSGCGGGLAMGSVNAIDEESTASGLGLGLGLPAPLMLVKQKSVPSSGASAASSVSGAGPEDGMSMLEGNGSEQEVAAGVDYQSLFKQVSAPLAVAGLDGRFIDANVRFEMATGYSKEELAKLTFFNLVAPDELQETFGTVARMLNQPGTGEARLTRRALPKQGGGAAAAAALGGLPGGGPLYITISLVRQGTAPQFFQCSLH